MVLVLSSAEHSSLCGTRKVSSEENFMCHCFMKKEMLNSCNIPVRPWIEFSMPMQFTNKRTRNYSVTDSFSQSWARRPQKQRPCMRDSCLLCSLLDRDDYMTVKSLKSVSPVSKQILDKENVVCQAINGVGSKYLDSVDFYSSNYGLVEEPWLPQHSGPSHHSVDSDLPYVLMNESEVPETLDRDTGDAIFLSESTKDGTYLGSEINYGTSHEGRFPHSLSFEENSQVEEPWLVQAKVHSRDSDPSTSGDAPKNEGLMVDRETTPEGQNQKIHGKLLAAGENSVMSVENAISTVILINSSICTMQRIAVLENGKLVELLLEPVKNNVQCDSVYLGVITKLVPNMGGAFVNIGGPRPSLMDIKPNREPFVFPPIWYTKERDRNSSLHGKLADMPGILGSSTISHVMDETVDIKDDEIEDDSEEFMDDEFGEHDNGDSWEVLKRNCNGTVANHGADVEDTKYLDRASRNDDQPPGPDVDRPPNHDKFVCSEESKWIRVKKGTRIVVQVVKEELGTKGPTLTAYPKLKSRFWILMSRCNTIGISKKIAGVERTRLRVIAKTLQPPGFGLTVRTVAAGHSLDELQKDLEGLLSTWKSIMEHAKSAALASDEGVDGAVPVMLHQAMGQTLSVVQDYFNEKVDCMIVDSPRIYHEVTNYLQEVAPNLCDRVDLYNKASPLFDEYKIEEEIDSILSKRVQLANGGYLVIEQTEALVSVDVNGGQCVLGQGTSKEKAILDVNLAAAKQIARELRLRDIGGIIVVDFIDMQDDLEKRLVYEEVKKAVERDRSTVKVSELSKYGLMELTRKRVRPSVTFMISEQCTCCSGVGRVEALDTSFSKIEHEICRLLSIMDQKANPEDPSSWPSFVLRVDQYMCNYLTSGKRTKLAVLSSSLKVWILLKVDRGYSRGSFDLKPVGDDKESKQQHKSAIPILRTRDVGANNASKKVTIFPIKKWRTGGK